MHMHDLCCKKTAVGIDFTHSVFQQQQQQLFFTPIKFYISVSLISRTHLFYSTVFLQNVRLSDQQTASFVLSEAPLYFLHEVSTVFMFLIEGVVTGSEINFWGVRYNWNMVIHAQNLTSWCKIKILNLG